MREFFLVYVRISLITLSFDPGTEIHSCLDQSRCQYSLIKFTSSNCDYILIRDLPNVHSPLADPGIPYTSILLSPAGETIPPPVLGGDPWNLSGKV